jgi:hypothetical protein
MNGMRNAIAIVNFHERMNRYNNPIKVPTVFDSISGKNAVIDS